MTLPPEAAHERGGGGVVVSGVERDISGGVGYGFRYN